MDVPPIRVFFSRWSCMDDEYGLEAGLMKYAPPSFVLPDAPEDDSICVSPEMEIKYIYNPLAYCKQSVKSVHRGPSTYDIRFFGLFLTYLPTHIRFFPNLKPFLLLLNR